MAFSFFLSLDSMFSQLAGYNDKGQILPVFINYPAGLVSDLMAWYGSPVEFCDERKAGYIYY